jgi:hypothetical protein
MTNEKTYVGIKLSDQKNMSNYLVGGWTLKWFYRLATTIKNSKYLSQNPGGENDL